MIVSFSIQNYGPFKDEVSLNFVADDTNTHLATNYVRELPMSGRVQSKSLRLLRVALIYGANASGKSSVLQALSFIDRLATRVPSDKEQKLDANTFKFQSPNQENTQKNSLFKLCFYREGVIYDYHVEVSNDAIVKESLHYKKTVTGKSTEVFNRLQRDTNDYEIIYGDNNDPTVAEKDFIKTSLQSNSSLLALVGKKGNVRIEAVNQAYMWFKQQLMGEVVPDSNAIEGWALNQIDNNKVEKKEVMRFQNLSGFEFDDIRFEKKRIPPHIENLIKSEPQERQEQIIEIFSTQRQALTQYSLAGEKFELKLEQESLGTKRYLALSVVLAKLCDSDIPNKTSRVLPIDEIEHSLHPDLLEHFLTLFLQDSSNSQLIATTHYRELLNKELLICRDAIWFTERDTNTLSSDLYALTAIDVQGFRSTSNIANFYKAGRLGAVPKFRSTNTVDVPTVLSTSNDVLLGS